MWSSLNTESVSYMLIVLIPYFSLRINSTIISIKTVWIVLLLLLGGYYVIEQARLQLHLIALNTNYYSEVNYATAENEEMDPGGQFAWFESILLKARRRRGTVSPLFIPMYFSRREKSSSSFYVRNRPFTIVSIKIVLMNLSKPQIKQESVI